MPMLTILHNGAPITDVTPGGAPAYVPGFEMVPAARSDAVQGMPGRMLQVQHDGVDIGNDRPAVINIVAEPERMLVTRGAGGNSHVVTLRQLVVNSYFTSHLYPIESEANQLAMGGAIPVSGSLIVWPLESVQFGATYPASGALDVVLKTYPDQLTETVQFGATYPLSGDLVTVLKTYTDQLTETVQFGATYPLSGTLETVLVTHPHQLTETVKFGATYPVSGTLV